MFYSTSSKRETRKTSKLGRTYGPDPASFENPTLEARGVFMDRWVLLGMHRVKK